MGATVMHTDACPLCNNERQTGTYSQEAQFRRRASWLSIFDKCTRKEQTSLLREVQRNQAIIERARDADRIHVWTEREVEAARRMVELRPIAPVLSVELMNYYARTGTKNALAVKMRVMGNTYDAIGRQFGLYGSRVKNLLREACLELQAILTEGSTVPIAMLARGPWTEDDAAKLRNIKRLELGFVTSFLLQSITFSDRNNRHFVALKLYAEGYSYAKVGRAMYVSPQRARQLAHKAARILRSQYQALTVIEQQKEKANQY